MREGRKKRRAIERKRGERKKEGEERGCVKECK